MRILKPVPSPTEKKTVPAPPLASPAVQTPGAEPTAWLEQSAKRVQAMQRLLEDQIATLKQSLKERDEALAALTQELERIEANGGAVTPVVEPPRTFALAPEINSPERAGFWARVRRYFNGTVVQIPVNGRKGGTA